MVCPAAAAGAQPCPDAPCSDEASIPRQLDRQQGPARGPAFALAHAIAFVGELEALALGVALQALGLPPGAIGAAVAPAGAGCPDRLRPVAARERYDLLRGGSVPRAGLHGFKIGGPRRARQSRPRPEHQSHQDNRWFHDIRLFLDDSATLCRGQSQNRTSGRVVGGGNFWDCDRWLTRQNCDKFQADNADPRGLDAQAWWSSL